MPDLVPDDRIELPLPALDGLQPGESWQVHRAILSVTNDKRLVVPRTLDADDVKPKPEQAVVISRDSDGTWCADLTSLAPGYRIKPVPMQDLLARTNQLQKQYITIEKIRW
jgi:hypothetical protein